MKVEFDYEGFHKFRCAHAHANNFLYSAFIVFALIIGLIREFLGINTEFFSLEMLYIFIGGGILYGSVSHLGYKLARHVVGGWYIDEYGSTYKEYRTIEKTIVDKQRKEN